MTRRIVFVGGPQTKALARAYRSEVAFDSDDEIAFVGTEFLVREAALRVIAHADQLVMETDDQGDAVAAGLLPHDGEVIRVPAVDADFLWPFAGRPHPRQAGEDGPYPAEHGDSFLDRMIQEGVHADEAVQRYLALDIGREAGLDLMLARRLEHQAALDGLTGQDIAGFVEQRFRTVHLFASRPKPRLPLFRRIASAIFDRLGAPPEAASRLRLAAVANNSQPIHPGVLAHFGMAVPEAGHRYRMQDEGRFTFEEYCRRYLAYEWNETLHRGIALARTDPAQAIGLLRAGLERSPDSRAGRRALKAALEDVGAEPDPTPMLGPGPEPAEPVRAPVAFHRPEPQFRPDPEPETGPEPQPEPEQRPGSAPVAAQVPALIPMPVPYPEEEGEQPSRVALFATGADPLPGDPGIGVSAETMRAEAAPRAYVELPPAGALPELEAPRPRPSRYEPLPPSHDLIEVLPGLLQQGDGLAHALSRPFASMPEAMPPPPLRLVLPPELQEEQPKQGFFSRLSEFFTG